MSNRLIYLSSSSINSFFIFLNLFDLVIPFFRNFQRCQIQTQGVGILPSLVLIWVICTALQTLWPVTQCLHCERLIVIYLHNTNIFIFFHFRKRQSSLLSPMGPTYPKRNYEPLNVVKKNVRILILKMLFSKPIFHSPQK